MKPKIFIDGEHGTTGLQIRQRLGRRDDLDILSIPESERRNAGLREEMLKAADVAILCLPDDAAREAVAMLGEDVVGYAVFWCVVDQGELGNVAVTESARGRGIGELLVGEIIRRAAARGVREVFLEVRPSNATARRLYERFGFRMVGRRRNYYQEPVEDALVLRRPVELDTTARLDS